MWLQMTVYDLVQSIICLVLLCYNKLHVSIWLSWTVYAILTFLVVSVKILCLMIYISLCRALELEHDDLHVKSREAEMEVNMLQMKKEEAENHLSQLHKDRDCKLCFVVLKEKKVYYNMILWDVALFGTSAASKIAL